MKKKIKKLIHKYISIPKYEKELRLKDEEIDRLKQEKEYLQGQVYKYKNKVDEFLLERRQGK